MKSLPVRALLVATLVMFSSSISATAADLQLTQALGGAQPTVGVRTIPYFSDSFTFDGVAYPYTMVGTDPRTSQATTTVPTVIVPLRFVFSDGEIADVGSAVDQVLASPLFQTAHFKSGNTQYGDAIRRAMFWSYDAGTDYHVLLGQPSVLPTQTIDVPAGQGSYVPAGTAIGTLGATTIHAAVPLGVISDSWFSTRVGQLLNALGSDPTTLPILLSRNVVEASGTAGFHQSSTTGPPDGNQQVQTAIWSSYGDPYFYAETPNIAQNVDILSHEIAEWLHDPFVGNTVPAWESPLPLSAAFYGCTSLLETGDAVADVGFNVNGYQLQDEAFLSWFAHQAPSIGIDGRYTYLGTLTQPSPPC